MIFKKLFELMTEKENFSMSITKKGEELTLSVILAESNKPLVMSGLPEELDEEFFNVLAKPIEVKRKFTTNVEDVVKDIETKGEEIKVKAEKKAATTKKATEPKIESIPKEPSAADQKKAAKELIKQGATFFTEGKYKDALAKYELAKQADPSLKNLDLEISKCNQWIKAMDKADLFVDEQPKVEIQITEKGEVVHTDGESAVSEGLESDDMDLEIPMI